MLWIRAEVGGAEKRGREVKILKKKGLLSFESINRPGKIVTFLKLETFQGDKARGLSRFVNIIGVPSLNY